jgi:translocation and assembly module TamA
MLGTFLSPARRNRALVVALFLLGAVARDACGADPQPYSVTIAPTGQADLDRALRDASLLLALRQKAPVGPFALVTRARDDARRFDTVLQSFGYYKGQVRIRIAGEPLDDPALVPLLERTPAGTAVPVAVAVARGPLFRLGKVSVQGTLPADIRDKIGLRPGDPAIADKILAVRARILLALQQQGHAFAKVSQPSAVEYPNRNLVDVSWTVDPGPRVAIGPIRLEGLKHVHPAYVRRLLPLHPGQLYQPSAIEKARQELASLDLFSAVQARAAERLNQQGLLPVTFQFTEAPAHVVSLGGLYSTDLGAALNASWTDRNLFGNGEKLTLSAAATELGGTASLQPGYNVGAQLLLPAWLQPGQQLQFNAAALRQYLETYQQTAFTAGATLTRKFSDQLSGSVGLALEQEQIIQVGVTSHYTLLSLPITLKFDNTDNLFEPTRGFRATATVTPAESLGGQSGNTPFVTLQANGSTYIDLSGNGRSILALRALVGAIAGATQFQIPPDQRLYAGGSDTVRGYKYQWISPHFPFPYEKIPEGGTAMDAGTIEFRQRIGAKFGAVAFVDAGQVNATNTPFGGPLDVGAGVGVRYFTSFGPIRLDFAVPLNRIPGNDSFEFYIGIGEAF